MAKKQVCRSCELQYRELRRRTDHELVDVGFHCPVCDNSGKCYSHEDDALWGTALECKRCHNYILYLSPKGEIDKDEIYLPKNLCVTRYFSVNDTTIYSLEQPYDKTIVSINRILQFDSKKSLINKVRTMIMFS